MCKKSPEEDGKSTSCPRAVEKPQDNGKPKFGGKKHLTDNQLQGFYGGCNRRNGESNMGHFLPLNIPPTPSTSTAPLVMTESCLLRKSLNHQI